MSRYGEERLDKAWQQSEPIYDDAGLTWEAEEVFDDQTEALAMKPVERLEHRVRGSVHPSLIHVHGQKRVEQRGVFVCAPAGVIGHHVVGRVKTQTVLSREATGDGRFAGAAPAADPVDVSELFPKRRTVGSLFVPFR